MNTVERVISICKERGIPLSHIERDLGFANGYLGQLRKGTLPNDRLTRIADYLDLPAEYLSTGEYPKIETNRAQNLCISDKAASVAQTLMSRSDLLQLMEAASDCSIEDISVLLSLCSRLRMIPR